MAESCWQTLTYVRHGFSRSILGLMTRRFWVIELPWLGTRIWGELGLTMVLIIWNESPLSSEILFALLIDYRRQSYRGNYGSDQYDYRGSYQRSGYQRSHYRPTSSSRMRKYSRSSSRSRSASRSPTQSRSRSRSSSRSYDSRDFKKKRVCANYLFLLRLPYLSHNAHFS